MTTINDKARRSAFRLRQFAARQPKGDHSRQICEEGAEVIEALRTELSRLQDAIRCISHLASLEEAAS